MASLRTANAPGESYRLARQTFATEEAAAGYPNVYGPLARHQREQRTIRRALEHIPRGASVLDLPCGTGRATRLLLERGFRVTGADASPPMVRAARENYQSLRHSGEFPDAEDVTFSVRDVMGTGFETDQFDAVFCNRLLHHFAESPTRRAALAELARICRGPIVVSFFNSFSLDAIARRLRKLVHIPKRHGVDPRASISLGTFAADAAAAGLAIEAKMPARWGISQQWYLVLRRA
jgi:SAM-dependent methyltransferase